MNTAENNQGENSQFPELPKPFQLNWGKQAVVLAGGRFKDFLNRPSTALILARDLEIPSEVPIAKDRSYALNEGSDKQNEIDAEYYEKVKAGEPEGYQGIVVRKLHKAQAFRLLYRRTIFIAPHSSAFDPIVEIWEIIGDPDTPQVLVKHFIKNPEEEKDFTAITNAINNARIAPDKNGKQKFVTKSSLAKAIAFYRKHVVDVQNAFFTKEIPVEGNESETKTEQVFFSAETRDEFINWVDPLIQEMIVAEFVTEANKLVQD